MKTYAVKITATVTKKVKSTATVTKTMYVLAPDEDLAQELANEGFTVSSEGDERHECYTQKVEEVFEGDADEIVEITIDAEYAEDAP